MPRQVRATPGTDAILILPAERLRHDPHEALPAHDRALGAHVDHLVGDGLVDPLGQLGALLGEAAVREHHDAVVVLAAEDAAEALRGVAHGVEGQEIVLADAVRLAQELEPGLEDARLGVLERHADAEHGAAVVVVEVDALGDLPAGDAQQDGAAAVAAGGAVRLERERRLLRVGRLDEDELVLPDVVEDAHALPHADDGFHVEVRGEEDDEAVGRDPREVGQQRAVVAHHARLVADLEGGGDGRLVAAARDDHGQEGGARERHRVGFLHHGREAEHLGVHLQGGDGARGDDDRGEAVEDGLDGDGGVEAGEVQDRVGHGGGVGFVRFEDEEEAFVVGRGQRGEGGDFLQRLVVFDVGELERADEGCETLGAEAERFSFDEGEVLEVLEEGGRRF